MAQEGVRFTRYYAASPICSPSRCGLLTGQFPGRWRITSYLQTRAGNRACGQADFLDPAAPSLPRALKAAGYATAHVGKWHLGGGRDVADPPKFAAYGYDVGLGTWESPEPHPDITARDWIWSADDKVKRWDRTGWMVDRTLDFLKAHPAAPCFVNLWLDDPHTPWVPSADDQQPGKSGRTVGKGDTPERLAKVLTEMDRQVGRLLDAAAGPRRRTGRRWCCSCRDNGPLPTFDRERTVGPPREQAEPVRGRHPAAVHRLGAGAGPGRRDRTTPPCSRPSTCSRPCASCAGPTLPDGYAPDGEDLSAALLGKAPARDPSRCSGSTAATTTAFAYPGRKGDRSPERGRPGRELEAAGERRRHRGRAVRPRRRPERGDEPARRRAGRHAAADRRGPAVAEVAPLTLGAVPC